MSLGDLLSSGGGVSFNPYDVTGGIGQATFDGQNVSLSLRPDAQQLQDTLFGRAQDIYGGLSDQRAVAGDYFRDAMSLIAPQQAQQRSNLENRLFAQGRLGSTGGINQFSGLLGQQDRTTQQLAMESLMRGTQQRGQEIVQAGQLFNPIMRMNQSAMGAANLGLNAGQMDLQAQQLDASTSGMSPLGAGLFSLGTTALNNYMTGGLSGVVSDGGGGGLSGPNPLNLPLPGLGNNAPMTGGSIFNPYGYTGLGGM